METSDGSLDNVKKTKTTNTWADLDARAERFSVESDINDVVFLLLSCLSPTNDGSMRTNDMPAILDHTLKVRTQKIAIIANGPAGDWLLVNLCEGEEGRCSCASAVWKSKNLFFFNDA